MIKFLFGMFSRKKYLENCRLLTLDEQLNFFVRTIENHTDKVTDIKHWERLLDELYGLESADKKMLASTKALYRLYYELYLKAHFPDLCQEKLQRYPA